MFILTTGIALIILFLIGVIIVLILFLKEDELSIKEDTPKVSILVAARNEEDNIVDCLTSLTKLSYSNYEIWVGNDQSSDNTKQLIEAFIQDNEHVNLLNITENIGSAKGKSNVLAQLAHKADGEYFFITDADISVPENWIQHMLASFEQNSGIVSGFTITSGKSFSAKMQRIDWAYAMGMVKVVTDIGKPIVGIGNNMVVTREAYFSTGGYENLPFSIVEDYQLFTEITKKGYGFKNLLHKEVTAESKSITSLLQLLQQRKRWMFGAFKLPVPILIILILQAAYYSLAIMISFIKPQIGINLIALKTFIQAIFIRSIFNKIGEKISFFNLISFELYQLILSSSSLLFYLIPIKIKWKGREY